MAIGKKDKNCVEQNMDAIYRQYAKPLKKYIYSMCKDVDLADDIVSETFYKAIKNIDSFYGGNIFTWLCTIAKNTFYNHVKKKENRNVSLEDAKYVEPTNPNLTEDTFIQKERNMELYEMMQFLDTTEQEVVYLRVFLELSFKEIGVKLNKSENWSRVTFFRCREKLKRRMKNE